MTAHYRVPSDATMDLIRFEHRFGELGTEQASAFMKARREGRPFAQLWPIRCPACGHVQEPEGER